MGILEKNHNQAALKKLDEKSLNALCAELRDEIIKTAYNNGGHLSSNLGVVELIVALCKVFDFPKDKILFDVGHQCYAYKLLTDRYDNFSSIRKAGGISGFPSFSESEYDGISAGHAGTAVAAGLGYCKARDDANEDYYVISLVGDASFFNGENFEAVSFQNKKPNKFLVILNDNNMSIRTNSNGLYRAISNITTKKFYKKTNSFLSRTIGKCFLGRFLRHLKNGLKRSLSFNTFADKLGLKYVGEYDGHNLKELIKILSRIKEGGDPALLHVRTVKGKGYSPAENDCTTYHGVGAKLASSANAFSGAVSGILERALPSYPKTVAITAAMPDGTGLTDFAQNHPQNFVDVGIAEGFAVTYAAGIAAAGGIPVVFIYSAFLQRAYDQIINDVCINNLHVIFCIDRAGLVGSDGKTHQGAFDISYLLAIPQMTVLCPKSPEELELCFNVALQLNSPVAIRYPNGTESQTLRELCSQKAAEFLNVEPLNAEPLNSEPLNSENHNAEPLNVSLKWEELYNVHGEQKKSYAIFACGPRMLDLAYSAAYDLFERSGKSVAVINARVLKPLDEEALTRFSARKIIVLEEGVKSGGLGDSILRFFNERDLSVKIKTFALCDRFTDCASVRDQLKENGLYVEKIVNSALEM